MDDSGFFSIQVSMKRSFVWLMVVVGGGGGGGGGVFVSCGWGGGGGGGGGLIFISFSSGGSRGGAWGPRLLPYFLVKLRPKGLKKFFGDQPPLSQGVDPALFGGLVVIFQTINDWY